MPTTPVLVVPLALVAAPALFAQGLQAVDPFPYGPAPVALHGQAAGARWSGGWLGVDAQHPAGLGSYWMFENDVQDAGPFQSHGTAVGTTFSNDVPAAIAGWSTTSLSLAMANLDHVDLDAHIAKFADLNHGTIAAWIKTSTSGALTILGASDSSDPSIEIALSLSNGRPWYDVRGDLNSWSQVSTTATIHDGNWHHLCVSVAGNGVATLYVDGAVVDSQHQGFFRYVFDIDKMAIGRTVDSGGGQWYFDGLIDDLAVWASPLDAAEVLQLAQGLVPPIGIAGQPVGVGPMVEAGSLVHTGCLANGLVPLGNRIVSTSTARAGRSFPDIWNLGLNTTYYLSCMLRREDTNMAIEPALVELTDSGATRGLFGWDAGGNWVVGGIGATVGAEIMQPNTDYFCVLRIDSGSASLSDVAYLKVFAPGASIPSSDSGISSVGTGLNQWTAMSPNYSSGAVMGTIWLTPTGSNRIELDELRLGKSWGDVVRSAYGSGCLGAQIGLGGRPVLGSSVSLLLGGGAPSSFAAIMLGLSSTTSAFGQLPLDVSALGGAAGCFLLQSFDTSLVTVADTTGSASATLGFPAAPAVYGLSLFAQWVSLDLGLGGPIPARFSDAVQLLLQD